MTPVIHSFCVATRVGPRPRHLRHLLMDANEGKALCGVGPVRYIGEVDAVYGEGWPYCQPCMVAAPPGILKGWLFPPWEKP